MQSNNDDRLLYESQGYWMYDDRKSYLVSLGIWGRRVMLRFPYKSWQRLREIVAGIRLPDLPQVSEDVELYVDEDNVFVLSGDNDLIAWFTMNRMVSIVFDLEEWEGFRAMVLDPGDPVSCVHPPPWTVVSGY